MKLLFALLSLWIMGISMLPFKGKNTVTAISSIDTIAPVPTQPMQPNATKPNGLPPATSPGSGIAPAPITSDTLHPMH